MDEIWEQQQEQNNESGMDLCEQWHYEEQWYEKNHRLLDGFDKLRPIIKGEVREQNRNNDSTKTPF